MRLGSGRARDPSQGMSPGQPLHDAVVTALADLIGLSRRHIEPRVAAMNSAEKMVMHYADPTECDPLTGRKLYPHERSIVVPFASAALDTLVAFWFTAFTSRQPTIPLMSHNPSHDRAAEYMESVLESMHARDQIEAKIWSWLWAASLYGRGYLTTTWHSMHELVYDVFQVPVMGLYGMPVGTRQEQVPRWQVLEERQINTLLEPQMVLPDPRVPGWNTDEGEFCGYESWRSWNWLRRQEIEQQLFNIKPQREKLTAAQESPSTERDYSPSSYAPARAKASESDPGYYRVTQMWVRIIPAEWPSEQTHIGDGYIPEVWEFVLVNDQVVCRARPSECEQFPVFAMDSHLDLHKLSSPGDAELIQGLQQAADFFANARMQGLRKGIYQNLVYDPAGLYNPDDINYAEAGLRIRAKLAQFPIEKIVTVLPMPDVTRGVINDIEMLSDQIKQATGAVDSLQGIPMAKDRTATEVEGIMRSAQGRAGQRGRLMWVQGVEPWVRREIADVQSNLSEERYYRIVGDSARRYEMQRMGGQVLIGPQHLQGEIDLAPCDVTMPVNREKMGQLWMQLATMVVQNEMMAQKMNWVAMFKEAAHLMGARNFEDFVMEGPPMPPTQVMPNEQVDQQVERGNLVPQPGGPMGSAIGELLGSAVG